MPIDIKALQVLDKVFKEHDITYWLEGGTLIGAIREGEVIEWDTDMDVCVWFRDVLKIQALKGEFKKYGYNLGGLCRLELYKNHRHLMCIIPMKICGEWLVTNDIICKFAKTMVGIGACVVRHSKFVFTAIYVLSVILSFKHVIFGEQKYLGNFAYAKLYDDYYPVPEHVEKYLVYRFPNWQVPLKGKDWKKREVVLASKTYKNWKGYR